MCKQNLLYHDAAYNALVVDASTCMQLMHASSYPSTCTDEWFPQLVQYAPSVFLIQKAQVLSRSHA